VLLLPATATHLLNESLLQAADALMIDLEEHVAPADKAEARAIAGAVAQGLAESGAIVLLRVNSSETQFASDLEDFPIAALSGLVLPKVDSPLQVEALALKARGIPIVPVIETPKGVLNAKSVAAHRSVAAMGFIADGYARSIGIAPEPMAMTWAAQEVVACAHAHQLQCWGLPGPYLSDDASLMQRSYRMAAALGFTGAFCANDQVVGLANQCFSPNEAQVDWARRFLHAEQEALNLGLSFTSFQGQAVDETGLLHARRWLSLA
jgi:citrate lyase subunit beta / citryl-CoA lyase